MAKFHSIVSRREFMKGLGLAGAGVGVASLVSPVFHDLDELTASESASYRRPWWVKQTLEHHHPTVELDWSQINRIDQRLTTQSAYVNAQYEGPAAWKALMAEGGPTVASFNGQKGNRLRDLALNAGAGFFMQPWPASPVYTRSTFTGPTAGVPTPEVRGMPKWTGTPEEGSRILRAAAVFYGAGQIGGAELDHKLVFTNIKHGKTATANDDTFIDTFPPPLTAGPKIEFVNDDVGYETDEVKYLPNKTLMEVGVMIPMSREAWRTDDPVVGSSIRNAANISRYRIWTNSVQPGIQAFIRSLGYTGYGYPYPDMSGGLVPSQASAVLGGVSEMGRSSEVAINPEHGSTGGYYSLLTDLPMEHDRPIDAGIFRFCHTCRKCADACPSDSISQDGEPSWEIPQFDYKVPAMNMSAGKKVFWTNTHSCAKYRLSAACCICRPVCTFNVNQGAMVHDLIKSTASTTSLFNSFFWNLSKPFGYGLKDPDEWWDMSLPSWGTDSTLNAFDGGYRK